MRYIPQTKRKHAHYVAVLRMSNRPPRFRIDSSNVLTSSFICHHGRLPTSKNEEQKKWELEKKCLTNYTLRRVSVNAEKYYRWTTKVERESHIEKNSLPKGRFIKIRYGKIICSLIVITTKDYRNQWSKKSQDRNR